MSLLAQIELALTVLEQMAARDELVICARPDAMAALTGDPAAIDLGVRLEALPGAPEGFAILYDGAFLGGVMFVEGRWRSYHLDGHSPGGQLMHPLAGDDEGESL